MENAVAPASNRLETSGFTVTEKAMRPASSARCCFYCNTGIGGEHKFDCVLVSKRVKVRAIIEYEREVPATWTADDVEFSLNESSWCADNFVGELQAFEERLDKEGSCLCPHASFEFVADSSEAFLSEE